MDPRVDGLLRCNDSATDRLEGRNLSLCVEQQVEMQLLTKLVVIKT